MTAWYDDAGLVATLPWQFRAYAAYSRIAVDRRTGRVRGGTALLRLMHRLAAVLRLPAEARVRVAGRTAFVDLMDERVSWVFDELRGASPEALLLGKLLRPGDTFVDVGANHGSFAILAAERVGPTGRIVAVEAQPRLAELIRRSLDAAAAPHEVLAAAVGARESTATLRVPRAGSGSASVFGGYGGRVRGTIEVPVVRADAALAWREFPGRVVIKLDVEGSECAFLTGAAEMLATRRPWILVELNADSLRAAGEPPEALLHALRGMGYTRAAELEAYPATQPLASLAMTPQRNVLVVPQA